MLTIRTAQKKALADALFERWLHEHVWRFFPRRCEALGAARLRAVLSRAVGAARRLGFVRDGDVAHFVDLTFLFGVGFERSPRHPWVRPVLDDASGVDPRERMARLRQAALEHIERFPRQNRP
jgi:hypothetical protein